MTHILEMNIIHLYWWFYCRKFYFNRKSFTHQGKWFLQLVQIVLTIFVETAEIARFCTYFVRIFFTAIITSLTRFTHRSSQIQALISDYPLR